MTAMTRLLDRPGFMPRLSAHHLLRPRLAEPLLAAPARVKLLCAPGGSGKSALLAECAQQAPAGCQVYWLPLNGGMLDAGDFCSRLAQNLGLAFVDEATLLMDLGRWQNTGWVFLDDFCRQPAPELDALLDRLLSASSPALTWWLGARRRPVCNWPRLLLDDELFECGELSFRPVEIQQLLSAGQKRRHGHGVQRRLVRWRAHRVTGRRPPRQNSARLPAARTVQHLARRVGRGLARAGPFAAL
ncbi:ATP/maltotriose-dependent transcriptional regulator MalT [Pseudomonas tolaasii]